jgi:uncharacterized protein (DUF934 family)
MVEVLTFRDEAPVADTAVTLGAFLEGSNAAAVRIEPGEDARLLIPHLDRLALIEIGFPSFMDGRGYSSARVLREAGYAGELRAEGDVLLDQIRHMVRCGFDSFAPQKPITRAAAEEAIARFAYVYQPTVDGRTAVWNLRHG